MMTMTMIRIAQQNIIRWALVPLPSRGPTNALIIRAKQLRAITEPECRLQFLPPSAEHLWE
jgi:hypothetical protein